MLHSLLICHASKFIFLQSFTCLQNSYFLHVCTSISSPFVDLWILSSNPQGSSNSSKSAEHPRIRGARHLLTLLLLFWDFHESQVEKNKKKALKSNKFNRKITRSKDSEKWETMDSKPWSYRMTLEYSSLIFIALQLIFSINSCVMHHINCEQINSYSNFMADITSIKYSV